MPNAVPRDGWRVSEATTLVDLSRRDIQRACYEGKGGVGLLSPQDSSWGRRTYTREDLARLFLASELKRTGRSLPEVRDALAEQTAGTDGTEKLLGHLVERLEEEAEEVLGRLLKAKAFAVALQAEGAYAPAAELVLGCLRKQAASAFPQHAATVAATCLESLRRLGELCKKGLHPGGTESTQALESCMANTLPPSITVEEAKAFMDEALATPGMDVAIELWLGPGSHRFASEAWDTFDTRKEDR